MPSSRRLKALASRDLVVVCRGCGNDYLWAEMTVDHIRPVSRDGGDEPANLQLLCRDCNSRKGDSLDFDYVEPVEEARPVTTSRDIYPLPPNYDGQVRVDTLERSLHAARKSADRANELWREKDAQVRHLREIVAQLYRPRGLGRLAGPGIPCTCRESAELMLGPQSTRKRDADES